MRKQISKQNKKPLSRKLGKAQARESFSPLVEQLSSTGGVVEITDYGKIAAVMLGYDDYLQLVAQSGRSIKPERTLYGSGTLVGDLGDATKDISRAIKKSVVKTLDDL